MGKPARISLLFGAIVALAVLGGGVALAVPSPTTNGRGDPAGATPTVATTVSSSTWHFEGHHSGVEHFTLNTKRCPELDHHLRETFTLTDGTAWTFLAHYCGTIDADHVWTGVGTFTITAADSSTLSGSFTSSAQLPSVGVPYALDVAAGTGAFAGATGTCVLDNHLRPISTFVQHQAGIFVCDLHH